MTIHILINGATGRMGQIAIKALQSNPKFVIVGKTGHTDHLASTIKTSDAHVVIDFTSAAAVFKNTETIITAGAHPVIGTSGLTAPQVKTLQTQCERLKRGGMIVPNFSLGAILMMKYAKNIARYFPEVEIIEMHHAGKMDSPSGTAIRTAEMLNCTHEAQRNTKETIPNARGAIHENVHIHSVRLPGLLAHQQVIFGGSGETLTITHNTIDRECFIPGIRLACEKVMALQSLVYGLEEIL